MEGRKEERSEGGKEGGKRGIMFKRGSSSGVRLVEERFHSYLFI